jgi:ABC-type lipoprotein export system ATPase subunit/ABC-type transporter Mla maintaining outer membrane lipid asymmetry permease subunit MlaE
MEQPAIHQPAAAPAVTIQGLTVRLPGGRTLLHDANLEIRRGELVLLAGPSGSGKSTLLNLIAGFEGEDRVELQVQGTVRRVPQESGAEPAVGLVFQELALCDELSAEQNVQLAIDHRRSGTPAQPGEARQRLIDLAVPLGTPLRALSGGERQRVALARTLALDPPILLFDEPTTGLDPQRARTVAEMIARVHRASGKTVVVVTHHFEPFLPHHPRLILLDPAAALREVQPAELAAFFERPSAADLQARTPAAPAARRWLAWVDEPGRAAATLATGLAAALQGWSQPGWKLLYLFHYLRMVVLGPTALYVAIAGAMLGFVSIFFTFSQLPYAQVTLPLLTEELLSAAGSTSFRVLAPLLTCVLIAGKCGAAISADLGTRRLTRQFEALRSFGARPESYFCGNIFIALVVGAPLLAFITYATTCYSSLVAFLVTSEDATLLLFTRNFFARSWPIGRLLPYGVHWFLWKTALSGLVIAGLSYAIGSRPKASAVDVSRDVGLTIFWASLAVLAVHSAFSFFEF